MRPKERLGSLSVPLSLFDRLVDAEEIEAVPPEAVIVRTQQWVALCGLVYRLLDAPVPLLGFIGEVGSAPPVPLVAVAMLLVTVANLVLFHQVLVRRSASFLHHWAVMPVDCLVAVGLNLWLSAVLPPGTLDDSFRDVFWFYALGTVALWGGLNGLRAGVFLIVAAVPLQVGMYWLNGSPFGQVNVMHVVARLGWMVLIMVTVLIVAYLVRLGARAARAAGIRAGRQAEQVAMLRSVHDTVLQTLEAIALQAGRRPGTEERMRSIESTARAQAAELRALLRNRPDPSGAPPEVGPEPAQDLVAALRQKVEQARTRGLAVELVAAEVTVQPPPRVWRAVAEAVGEALTNVSKHAGTGRAVVRAVSTSDRLEVTVRDHGLGFDTATVRPGFGLPESINGRMREIGGDAEVTSRPGRGTRVRLWFPATDDPPPA